MLLSLTFIFLKPRYSNVFEEIYHDEYHHATTSFLRTNSTLNRVPDMEVNKTGGLLYGSISEKYRSEVLPTGVEGISYSFHFPDDKLDGGEMSINFRFNLIKLWSMYRRKKLIFHHTLLQVRNCYEIRLFQTGFPSILVNFQLKIGVM